MSTERQGTSPHPLLAGLRPEVLLGQGLAEDAVVREEPPAIPGIGFVRLLGRGGMGEVYLARQTSLEREVAVKLVDERRIGTALERFEREARAMAKLRHPNLVAIHSFERLEDGSAAIVMEYVEGGNLRELMDQYPQGMPAAEALPLMRGIGSALVAAHAAGIVHRDMKPENVLLDSDGCPRVGDFGLALPVEPGSTRLTLGGAVMGTLDYMAPERFRSNDADARSDIFAMGVILYEMLTGTVPRGHFDPPRQLRPDLPLPLSHAVMKALRADPQERFQSMDEFLTALAAPGTKAHGRRWFLPLAGAAGAACVAGVWKYSSRKPQPHQGGDPAKPADNPAPAPSPPPSKDGWQSLIPGADVSRGSISGNWRKENGELHSDASICILALRDEMPASYKVRAVFTRLSGEHSIAIFFRANNSVGSVDIDGWGEHLSGVQSIDWRDLRQAQHFDFTIENGREYELVISVTPDEVRIWIDGKEQEKFEIRGRTLGVVFPWVWKPEDRPAALAIGSYESPTRFSQLGWQPHR